MPRSSKKKKPNVEPEPESSSTSSDNDDDQDGLSGITGRQQENIQVDLEARTPVDTDRPAILYFLEQSFGGSLKKSTLDLGQLATQLIVQQTFGSVFYQPDETVDDNNDGDDDDPPILGICSFLRLDTQHNKQLQTWLLDKCAENEQAKTILQNSKCGFFVNERYMNIPADISLPAIRTLRSELQFPIDYWIVHSKLRLNKSDSNTIYYVNGEEEIFKQYSTITLDYYPSQSNASEWTHQRRIMFVSNSRLDQICLDIEQQLKQ